MQTFESQREIEPATARLFATTHWSVVRAAGAEEPEAARLGLEELCQAYWYPVYVYVRRRGYGPHEAKDLTQEFFAQVFAKRHLRLADPASTTVKHRSISPAQHPEFAKPIKRISPELR